MQKHSHKWGLSLEINDKPMRYDVQLSQSTPIPGSCVTAQKTFAFYYYFVL